MTDRDLHLLAQAIHGEALHRAWINYGGSETIHFAPAGSGHLTSGSGHLTVEADATISHRYSAHLVQLIRMAYTYGPTKGMSIEDEKRLWSAVEQLWATTTFKDPAGGGE